MRDRANREIAVWLARAAVERGDRYHWGGDDPGAADCSGLVSRILRATGDLGTRERLSAEGIRQRFADRDVLAYRDARSQPVAGDIIVYGWPEGRARHIAIAISEWHLVEMGGGGPETDTVEEAAEQNAYARVRPITHRSRERLAVLRLWPEE